MNDSQDPALPLHRTIRGEAGLGTVDPELVETRAGELALSDGRKSPNDADREAARAELVNHPRPGAAPETAEDPELEYLTEWDAPLDASGHRAPRVMPEDDINIAETLIEEGLEEADHDQRVTAARENPPEE